MSGDKKGSYYKGSLTVDFEIWVDNPLPEGEMDYCVNMPEMDRLHSEVQQVVRYDLSESYPKTFMLGGEYSLESLPEQNSIIARRHIDE